MLKEESGVAQGMCLSPETTHKSSQLHKAGRAQVADLPHGFSCHLLSVQICKVEEKVWWKEGLAN